MSKRELHRFRLMGLVEVGKITLKEASEKMGVSYRQAKRTWSVYKTDGVAGLVHGNRDRPPCNRVSEDVGRRCLMASVDGATSRLVAARFFPFECLSGYIWLLRRMVDKHGIPVSIYQDSHSSLKRYGGTERLEKEVEAIFEGIVVTRIDRDYGDLLDEVESGRSQVMLGT